MSEEIARVEARGAPGTRVSDAHRELRDDPPDRPPLGTFDPGSFPPGGKDLRVRGPYHLVEGVAIRYLD